MRCVKCGRGADALVSVLGARVPVCASCYSTSGPLSRDRDLPEPARWPGEAFEEAAVSAVALLTRGRVIYIDAPAPHEPGTVELSEMRRLLARRAFGVGE